MLIKLPDKLNIIVDFTDASLVDHSFISFITYFKDEYESWGGKVIFKSLEKLTYTSKHPLSTRILKRKQNS